MNKVCSPFLRRILNICQIFLGFDYYHCLCLIPFDIAQKLSFLCSAGFILTSMGAVLAVPGIDLGSWVAITVAMSTAVSATVEYFQVKTERDTRNANLGEFQNLMTWWESLSIIDKRTRKAKNKALQTIEGGELLLAERRAGAAFAADRKEGDGEEE